MWKVWRWRLIGGGGGLEGWHKRSRVRAHIRLAYLHTCEPTVPGMQRWITMETDCEPMGKQSNYDVLGKQSECWLKSWPRGHQILRHTLLHHLSNYTACQWVIYCCKATLRWQTVGNGWANASYVGRLGVVRLTYTALGSVRFDGITASNKLKWL